MVRDMLGHVPIATTPVYSHVVVGDEVPPDALAFANANGKAPEGDAA